LAGAARRSGDELSRYIRDCSLIGTGLLCQNVPLPPASPGTLRACEEGGPPQPAPVALPSASPVVFSSRRPGVPLRAPALPAQFSPGEGPEGGRRGPRRPILAADDGDAVIGEPD